MMLRVSATEHGTSEEAWLASANLRDCPPLHLEKWTRDRIVVVAPHPDDEVLAVGGLLRRLVHARSTSLMMVAVTDGEASHPRSQSVTPAQLAERRAVEREQALAHLELSCAEIVRLRVPDGQAREASDLTDRIADTLRGADLCIAPWERDGHPDHDAAGLAATHACEARGTRLLRYPVWAWHWAQPDQADFPWERARRVELDGETVRCKHRAIGAYASQIAPLGSEPGDEAILPPAVLARFLRSFEIVFV